MSTFDHPPKSNTGVKRQETTGSERPAPPRRRDLPDHINDFPPDLLRQLCEVHGWNIRDLYDEVQENCKYRDVRRRVEALGIQPDQRKSPRENIAAVLWRNDPEDLGLDLGGDDA